MIEDSKTVVCKVCSGSVRCGGGVYDISIVRTGEHYTYTAVVWSIWYLCSALYTPTLGVSPAPPGTTAWTRPGPRWFYPQLRPSSLGCNIEVVIEGNNHHNTMTTQLSLINIWEIVFDTEANIRCHCLIQSNFLILIYLT